MKEPTKKQMEVLFALNPHRVDINKTVKQVSKELGVSIYVVNERMRRLKERCPEVYEDFCNLRKMFNRDKRGLENPLVLDPKDIEQLEERGKIKEIF